MHRRDERGAVALFVALLMTVVLGITALTVDIGQQRVGRADMQSLADMVALDMAREITGKKFSTYDVTALNAARDQSVARNLAKKSSGVIGKDATVAYRLGTTSSAGFQPAAATDVPTAVEVTASTSVDFTFAPGSGGASRSAVAVADVGACFSIGSYAAAIRSGDSGLLSPLLGLLGSNIDANVASYQGLANAQVTLQELATSLNVGTVDALANASVTLENFYIAVVSALQRQGDTAAASALQAIVLKLGPVGNQLVRVGNLVSLDTANEAGLALAANAFDLVASSAFLANGSSGISVPALAVADPALTGVAATASIVQKPQTGCGRVDVATAESSQVALTLTGGVRTTAVPAVSGLLESLGLTVDVGAATVVAHVARSTGLLTAANCRSPQSLAVDVTSNLLPVTLTLPLTLSAGFLGTIQLTATVTTVPSQPGVTSVLLGIPDSYEDPVSGTGGALNLSTLAVSTTANGSTGLLAVLGVTLSALANSVESVIVRPLASSIIAPLETLLTGPLSSLLGLRLAGTDLWSVPVPQCAEPSLRG